MSRIDDKIGLSDKNKEGERRGIKRTGRTI